MNRDLMKIGRVARAFGGVGFPHEFQGRSGDYPFIKVSDLSLFENRDGIVSANNFVSLADLHALRARVAPEGSIVFPKVGAALLNNARALLKRPVAMDNNLMAVVPSWGEPRYWFYALQTVDLGELSGSGPLPFISEGQVRDLRLPFPPDVKEQRRISDFLDAETARIDRLIQLREDHMALIQEQRTATVTSLVTGHDQQDRRPSGLPWHPDLPAAWPTVKLSYVADLGSGHTPSRSHPEWWTDCYIPWITTGEVQQVRDDRREVLTETRESISDLGLANSAAELHPIGTVVLCRTASAGYSAVMGNDMATSQDFATWTCGVRLDPFFLLWCLRAMRPDLLGRLAMGSTHKTIYMPDIQSIRVPLPPLADQHEIVSQIRQSNEHLDPLVDAMLGQQALLRERRSALIAAAVSGEFDVTTARGAA
jgi:type I restriction enzyme S subunit